MIFWGFFGMHMVQIWSLNYAAMLWSCRGNAPLRLSTYWPLVSIGRWISHINSSVSITYWLRLQIYSIVIQIVFPFWLYTSHSSCWNTKTMASFYHSRTGFQPPKSLHQSRERDSDPTTTTSTLLFFITDDLTKSKRWRLFTSQVLVHNLFTHSFNNNLLSISFMSASISALKTLLF